MDNNRIYMKRIVYYSFRKVMAWNQMRGDHLTRIATLVLEYKIWKFRFFRIKQFLPLIKRPLYDGEFSSNRCIKTYAVEEKAKAYQWINEQNDKIHETDSRRSGSN